MHILRDASVSDLVPITELIIECSKHYILPYFNEEGRHTYLESHSLDKMSERLKQFQYQVLEDDHAIIGVVGMRRPSHLYHLHVSKEFQGKGLGRRLWEAAKTRALKMDRLDEITVNSSSYAVPFYERLGFVAGVVENYLGVDYVPMTLKLNHLSIHSSGK